MDQQPTTTPGVRLPQPSLEPMATQSVPPQYPQQPVAPAATNPMQAPQMSAQAPVPTEPIVTNMPPTGAGTPDDDAQDEEWVARAKDIANTYRNDPYAQSKALSQLRVEYLQKQHGITVKIGEK